MTNYSSDAYYAVLDRPTSRLKSSDETINWMVRQFLEEAMRVAPEVQRDLLSRASDDRNDATLHQVARAWAQHWNLCGDDGPCDWAVLIGVETLRQLPCVGWNVSALFLNAFTSTGKVVAKNANEDHKEDISEVEIEVSAGTYTWKPWISDPDEIIEKILSLVRRELKDQVKFAAERYAESRKPARQWQSDRALVWLIRRIFLRESCTSISKASEKYLQKPNNRLGKPFSMNGIIRETEEIAAQLGLRLQKAPGGRPKGKREDPKSLRRIGAAKPGAKKPPNRTSSL